jgi:hypothetical protein
LRAEIRSGQAKFERKLAVCAGSADLSPEDRVEALAILCHDEAFHERAAYALLAQPIEAFLAALIRTDAAPELFTYCAENLAEKPGIADFLARNAVCPIEALVRTSRFVTSVGAQALFDNLDRLTSDPILIVVLERCPSLTAEQRELIKELQKGAGAEVEPELQKAIAALEPDLEKRRTMLQKLSQMNVVERVQLALKGGREERMMLIRDSNKVVQRAVLQSPKLSPTEVESFAAMGNLNAEILRVISTNRGYMKNYTIVRNLASNPKTPLEVSLHLLPRLIARDLKILTTNKNVPDVLRSNALKLHRQRNETRSQS